MSATVNVTVVESAFASANVTPSGPLHVVVMLDPRGYPSSCADPATATGSGRSIDRSGPASTTGAAFCGSTVITTSSLVVSAPSVAVSRSVYVPAAANVTVVDSTLASANVTPSGPLHAAVVLDPRG